MEIKHWKFEIRMAGVLGVITRLRNPLLASLRDSPKPRSTGVTRDDFLGLGSWVLGPKPGFRPWYRSIGVTGYGGKSLSHQGRGRVRLWCCLLAYSLPPIAYSQVSPITRYSSRSGILDLGLIHMEPGTWNLELEPDEVWLVMYYIIVFY